MARQNRLAALCVALAGALAACGGGAGAAESSFARDANDLCREHQREGLVGLGGVRPQSFDEVAVLAEDDARTSAQRYEDFRRLRVPKGARNDFRRIEDLQDERLGVLGDLTRAASARNGRAVEGLLRELQSVEDELSDEYLRLGLDECVRALG